MQSLKVMDGLLYTSLKLSLQGKSIVINDVIVDTGSFHTIISTDYIDQMELELTDEDELVKASGYGGTVSYSVRKKIDRIECDNIVLENVKIDFGEIDPNDRVNGLLGLDFLMNAGVVIDLVDLTIYKK